MAKYVFFSFPAYGHVNPTLAIVQELIARGEEVVYYLTGQFRQPIEATGATFRTYQFGPYIQEHPPVVDPADGDRRIAMLLVYMLQKSPQVIPQLLESVRAEQADFYNMCFSAFGNTEWQVVLSLGKQVDRAALHEVPANFLAAAHVPQLEVLARTDIFVSHGGMNSVMESLYYGVPLVVIPQIMEQEATAKRVQELGLGIALDRTTVTADVLREAVAQVAYDPAFLLRVQTMQQEIREAGGYIRATDAIMQFVRP